MGELEQVVEVTKRQKPDAFVFTGIVLEGATWGNEGPELTDELFFEMPLMGIRFVKEKDHKPFPCSVSVPLYMNPDRATLVTTFDLKTKSDAENTQFLQRGLALLLWYKS